MLGPAHGSARCGAQLECGTTSSVLNTNRNPPRPEGEQSHFRRRTAVKSEVLMVTLSQEPCVQPGRPEGSGFWESLTKPLGGPKPPSHCCFPTHCRDAFRLQAKSPTLPPCPLPKRSRICPEEMTQVWAPCFRWGIFPAEPRGHADSRGDPWLFLGRTGLAGGKTAAE